MLVTIWCHLPLQIPMSAQIRATQPQCRQTSHKQTTQSGPRTATRHPCHRRWQHDVDGLSDHHHITNDWLSIRKDMSNFKKKKKIKKAFVWAIGQWHSVYFFLKHFLFFLWKKKWRCDVIAVFLVYFYFTSGPRVLASLFYHGNGSSMAMRSVLSFAACKLSWLNKFSLNCSSVLLTNNFTTLTTRWHYFVTKKMTNYFLRISRTVRYSVSVKAALFSRDPKIASLPSNSAHLIILVNKEMKLLPFWEIYNK